MGRKEFYLKKITNSLFQFLFSLTDFNFFGEGGLHFPARYLYIDVFSLQYGPFSVYTHERHR